MKKLLIIMAALSIVLTQCKKPVVEKPEVKEDIFISFSAGVGINKADIDLNSGSITWNDEDKVYVLHNGKLLEGYLTASAAVGARANVSGTVTGVIEASEKFYFLYVGSGVDVSALTPGTASASLKIADQTENNKDVGEYMIGGTAGVDLQVVESKYVPVTPGYIPFTPITAVIRVNAGELTGNIEFCGDNAYNATQISVVDGKLTPASTKGTINFIASEDAAVSVLPTSTTEGNSETFGFYQTSKLGVIKIKNGIKSGRIYVKKVEDGVAGPIDFEVEDFVVNTVEAQGIHSRCASSGGYTTAENFDYCGVCWGTSANPTKENESNTYFFNRKDGEGNFIKKIGQNPTFTGFMSNLSPSTTYHYRAFIVKAGKVLYGDDLTFTTKPASYDVLDPEDYVEVDGVLWAKWNLGATAEKQSGDYYMWGDLACCTRTGANTTQTDYWRNYLFSVTDDNGTVGNNRFSKYCLALANWYDPEGTPDGKSVLDEEDDVVSRTIGNGWRMPTADDWYNLARAATNITYSETTHCFELTLPNGKLYFLADGYRYKDKIRADFNETSATIKCWSYTWVNSICTINSDHSLETIDGLVGGIVHNPTKPGSCYMNGGTYAMWRSDGMPIRPVKDATTVVAPGFN